MSADPTPVTDDVLAQIALSRSEYELARQRLGREPTPVELGMIGALWSEHCGYKHSRPLFRYFPTDGPQILTTLGSENAGAVDIGDGWVVVMKIESHNHPSAIEPYEGAATGVGGIVRDIFAMGARPIALLDSLRFGPLDDPHNRHLFSGVVSGIGGYGNCLGIPNVGGEVVFGAGYSGNPLVNAMCVGIAPAGSLVSATTAGPGNALMVVGADTGKDGLHGATFASVELDEASQERRPAVQVGNPFLEKLLMEACVQLVQEHRDWIVGLQDLGAAGLTSASVESAERGGTGLRIDTNAIPRREANLTPYDVMLSESQERMLALVKPGHEDDVRQLFERWELATAIVGVSTDDGLARIVDGPDEVAAIDIALLTDPPTYEGEAWRDPGDAILAQFDPGTLPDVGDAGAALLRLLASPNIADKSWVTRQYDHQVLTNTVVVPGSDAGVVRIKGSKRAIALCTDGDGRAVRLEPRIGGARCVAEAARNVACSGARPLAVTDCLNFGNPERPETYYQLAQAIQGIADACRALGTPVVSGNVSLYNETPDGPVTPTPVIGMLGLIEDVSKVVRMPFRDEGDRVMLLGADVPQKAATLGASEYLALEHDREAGPVAVDLPAEAALVSLLNQAADGRLLHSAHDCAHGGLAVALAECAIAGDVGLDASALDLGPRLDAALFGEAGARAVVSLHSDDVDALTALAADCGVLATPLGTVTGSALHFGQALRLEIVDLAQAHQDAIPLAMGAALTATEHLS
ncbi:MAG: phosphoribosylformylglycinamidine synthase subunit PurL [Chloroflexi bacterium]|nr:phosphoribosylformylglycinamidine synthase subunit PurL [Chloroflexota bacterium]